jgi:hypothetical protein
MFVFFLVIVVCLGDIKVSVHEKGEYKISINGKEWVCSSHTALYVDNKCFSTDDNSRPLINIVTDEGDDEGAKTLVENVFT